MREGRAGRGGMGGGDRREGREDRDGGGAGGYVGRTLPLAPRLHRYVRCAPRTVSNAAHAHVARNSLVLACRSVGRRRGRGHRLVAQHHVLDHGLRYNGTAVHREGSGRAAKDSEWGPSSSPKLRATVPGPAPKPHLHLHLGGATGALLQALSPKPPTQAQGACSGGAEGALHTLSPKPQPRGQHLQRRNGALYAAQVPLHGVQLAHARGARQAARQRHRLVLLQLRGRFGQDGRVAGDAQSRGLPSWSPIVAGRSARARLVLRAAPSHASCKPCQSARRAPHSILCAVRVYRQYR